MVLYTTKDETDASTFTFQDSLNGKWLRVSDDQNYGGTSMLVWAIGTSVRVDFRGKAATLFGTIDQGINATVSIDGGKPRTLFQSTQVKNYRQQLYNTSELDYGDHTLLVTQLFDHFPLIVDYVQVDTGETSNSADPPSDPSSGAVLPTISASAKSNQTVFLMDHSSLSRGGIAGIILACIIVLVVILVAILWRRRIRRRAEQVTRPHPLPPVELPLHTPPHASDTIAHTNGPEKAQLRALWQASQEHSLQTNRGTSSPLAPSPPTGNVKPGSAHTSSQDHPSSFPSNQEQTSSPRHGVDTDTTTPSPDMHNPPTSQHAPPPATDMTIVTGSSIPASGWSFHQRSLSFARNVVPESPTGSCDSRGTFDSSDLDHAVPARKDQEPELPPYPGSVEGGDTQPGLKGMSMN